MPVNTIRAFHLLICIISLIIPTVHAAGKVTPAPDFTGKTIDEKTFQLDATRGKVVMINFWASWCGPCRKEMPLLEDLYRQYQSDGFNLIGINVDEDKQAAEDFLEHTPVSFTTVLDPEGRISKQFDVKAMPTTFMIDREGMIRNEHPGYRNGDEDKYEKMIQQLLAE